MKLFLLESGPIQRLVAAESLEDAEAQGRDPKKHPDLHFRPFKTQEISVPGYEILVNPEGSGLNKKIEDSSDWIEHRDFDPEIDKVAPNFDDMNRDQLRDYLKDNDVKFFNGASESKLREIAKEHASK